MKKVISVFLVLAAVLAFSVSGFAADTISPFAVAPYSGGEVSSYSEAGTLIIIKAGKAYKLSDEYDYPTGLAADNEGNLYVSETGKDRIIKVDTSGKATVYIKDISEPMGLCYIGGKLYVAECGKNRILSFEGTTMTVIAGKAIATEDGDYAGGYVDGAVADAQFGHPRGVAVSEEGIIYVADTDNHAIRMIKDGVVSSVWANRDLKGELTKPGDIKIKAGTLEIYDMFLNKTLYLTIKEKNFVDVSDSDWFAATVKLGVARGIVSGVSETEFAPNENITRAMLACMLGNLELFKNGSTVIDGPNPFSDVPANQWYTKSVGWASAKGIVSGYAGQFFPTEDIIRQELVTMIYGYARVSGKDLTTAEEYNDEKMAEKFADYADSADYAKAAIKWAVANELLSGADGLLYPKDTATRAEALALVVKFMEMK